MLYLLAQSKMKFSDFQKGFQQWNDGKTDSSFSTGLLVIIAGIALIALLVHFRTRMTTTKKVDSESKLFRELARVVRIPFTTRLILKWVARSANIPPAVLLVSEHAYATCVDRWQAEPTFAPIRRWARARLEKLRTALFAE